MPGTCLKPLACPEAHPTLNFKYICSRGTRLLVGTIPPFPCSGNFWPKCVVFSVWKVYYACLPVPSCAFRNIGDIGTQLVVQARLLQQRFVVSGMSWRQGLKAVDSVSFCFCIIFARFDALAFTTTCAIYTSWQYRRILMLLLLRFFSFARFYALESRQLL